MELTVMNAAVEQVRQEYAFSQRRASGLLTMVVSSYCYQGRRSYEGLRERLVELAREKPRFGYRRLHVLLRRNGEVVNHKRVHRVYREAGLSIRRKKRRHCERSGQPLRACSGANQEWGLVKLIKSVVEETNVLSRTFRNLVERVDGADLTQALATISHGLSHLQLHVVLIGGNPAVRDSGVGAGPCPQDTCHLVG